MTLAGEVAESCAAMARYALAAGAPVPRWIVQVLSDVEVEGHSGGGARDGEAPDGGTGPGSDRVVRAKRLQDLVRAHDQLARLVAPAHPQTLVLLEREARVGGLLRSLGPVRLVRQLMTISVLFLVVFITTSLSPAITHSSGDLFESSGMDLLLNEVFFLSAAGIGASFAALFQVNRYIAKGTYDPKYDTSYWTRFILGLIAGIVLADLIPIEGPSKDFSRPLLALLGGFSAAVVYRILTRIVETLESFVRGEAPPQGWQEDTPAGKAASEAEERLKLASSLIHVQKEAGASDDPAVVNQKLQELVASLLNGEQPAWVDAAQPAPAEAAAAATGTVPTGPVEEPTSTIPAGPGNGSATPAASDN